MLKFFLLPEKLVRWWKSVNRVCGIIEIMNQKQTSLRFERSFISFDPLEVFWAHSFHCFSHYFIEHLGLLNGPRTAGVHFAFPINPQK